MVNIFSLLTPRLFSHSINGCLISWHTGRAWWIQSPRLCLHGKFNQNRNGKIYYHTTIRRYLEISKKSSKKGRRKKWVKVKHLFYIQCVHLILCCFLNFAKSGGDQSILFRSWREVLLKHTGIEGNAAKDGSESFRNFWKKTQQYLIYTFITPL